MLNNYGHMEAKQYVGILSSYVCIYIHEHLVSRSLRNSTSGDLMEEAETWVTVILLGAL